MDAVLIIMVSGYLGFLAGKWYSNVMHTIKAKKLIDSILVDNPAIKQSLLNLKIGDERTITSNQALPKYEAEKHGDILYLWDNVNSKFLCQGSTLEELATILKERFSPEPVMVVHDKIEWVFDDGRLYQLLDNT